MNDEENGRNGKTKPISQAQKLVILADAIVTSAPDAAARWGICDRTIYHWTEKIGGLKALRELYETKQIGAIAEMAGAIFREVSNRLPKVSEDHLIELALEQLRMNKTGTTTIVNAPSASAQAGASVSDDGIGRALIAAERAFLAECERPALGSAER